MIVDEKHISEEVWETGKAVFLRTVTMNYTGRIVRVTPSELVLAEAAWIADMGTRLSEFLTGSFNADTEIEPYPSQVVVSRGGIIDATEWNAALPKEKR